MGTLQARLLKPNRFLSVQQGALLNVSLLCIESLIVAPSTSWSGPTCARVCAGRSRSCERWYGTASCAHSCASTRRFSSSRSIWRFHFLREERRRPWGITSFYSGSYASFQLACSARRRVFDVSQVGFRAARRHARDVWNARCRLQELRASPLAAVGWASTLFIISFYS